MVSYLSTTIGNYTAQTNNMLEQTKSLAQKLIV